MKRLLAKWHLWRAGYCTKHLVLKTTVAQRYMRVWSDAYAGKIVVKDERIECAARAIYRLFPKATCEQCDIERDRKRVESDEEAIKILSK